MGDVIAVTGTRREAAVLRGAGVRPVAIGGLPDGLSKLAGPIGAVVSFGMAGALAPDLRIGDWVIGERVRGATEMECDPRWRAALAEALPAARIGPVYADGRLIGDPAEKIAIHRHHDALAADMESHLAARAAARAGVPFAVLRCISDEAAHALPPALEVAMRPDGGLALGAMLVSMFGEPGQIGAVAATLRGFALAYRLLRQGARSVPARLAFDPR